VRDPTEQRYHGTRTLIRVGHRERSFAVERTVLAIELLWLGCLAEGLLPGGVGKLP